MYHNDTQYEDHIIASVEPVKDGSWSITFTNGWSFWIDANSPVRPEPGMTARLYGRGIGYPIRGLALNGEKVYYWTEEEHEEKQEIDMYGASPADWLDRWDRGDSVWSIEMGGLGPGYEQAIQITVAEILRHLISKSYDWRQWEDKARWQADRDAISAASHENDTIKKLDLSGAQWGAALSLAAALYKDGPRYVMKHEDANDRKIQVQRTFPVA